MKTILFRHGFSEANNKYNFGTLAFAHADAPLALRGWYEASAAGETLRDEYGIEPTETRVAVSTLRRSGQTALGMGFNANAITDYALLDEIDHGLELNVLRDYLKAEIYPEAALVAADRLLDNLPQEPVFVTHGLLASAALYLAGTERQENEPFIQKFGTARVMTYDKSKRLDLDAAIETQKKLFDAAQRANAILNI